MTTTGGRRSKIGRIALITGFVLLTVVTVATYRLTAKLAEGSAGLERRERALHALVLLESSVLEFEARPCGPSGERALEFESRVAAHLDALGRLLAREPERETLQNLHRLIQEEIEACGASAASAPSSAAGPSADPAVGAESVTRLGAILRQLSSLHHAEISRLGADLEALREAARLAGPLAFLTSLVALALLAALLGLGGSDRSAETSTLASEADSETAQAAGEGHGTLRDSGFQARFLADLSHELRTPLNAISGFADLLAAGSAGPLTEKQNQFVGNIRQASKRILELADDIRDLSRIEAGTIELKSKSFSLTRVLTEALAGAKVIASSKKIEIIGPQNPERVLARGDPGRVRQVLDRLLASMIRAAAEGDRLEAGLTHSGDTVEVLVSEAAAVPTTPERAGTAETGPAQSPAPLIPSGAVLEPTLARSLVEAQRGKLEFEFEPGRGRRVKMSLPRGGPDSESPAEPT